VDAWTHRFRHHFSHTWLDRGGAEGDLMELNGWSSPQMPRRYGASARSARARHAYDRIVQDRVTGRCVGDRRTGPRPEIDVRPSAEGDTTTLRTLTGLLDTFDPEFNLVTPNATP
jgi:hypothetical protein